MDENKLIKTTEYKVTVYEFEKEGDVVVSIYLDNNNDADPIHTYAGTAAQKFIKDFHK